MTSSVDDEDVTWSFNVTEGEELVTQGEELVTQKLGFTMKTSAILDF